MWKLRQTWAPVYGNAKLYALDMKVRQIDPAWPITAQPPTAAELAEIEDPPSPTGTTIHVNPKFLSIAKVRMKDCSE